MNQEITCPRCKGEGSICLPTRFQRVLDWLKENPNSTAEQVHSALMPDLLIGGAYNLLYALEEFGFVQRACKKRKTYYWTAIVK